jgi:hypothetical protein
LVQAKKTQLDKDWPMIRRLIEADRFACAGEPNPDQLSFWLAQARTPSLLINLAQQFPNAAGSLVSNRPLLREAIHGNEAALEKALAQEEMAERAADKAYWIPLRRDLEQMSHRR